MKVFGITTGTLQLRPTFLEGSPAHGGPLGLILALRQDPGLTPHLPMWAWVIETAKERVLIDAGGWSGMNGNVTGTQFHITPEQNLLPFPRTSPRRSSISMARPCSGFPRAGL